MKQRNCLPLFAFLLGLCCACLRWALYRGALDDAGLLKTGTPLEWGVYALSAGSLLFFAAAAKKPGMYARRPGITTLGRLAGAVGIGWTAVGYPPEMAGVLGIAWKLSGMLAAACLLWTAFCGWQRRSPHFLTQLAPCLFWLVHMLDRYRGWSGEPQLQNYLFDLLGAMAITLYAYHTAAFSVDLGKPRAREFTALAAGFLCTAAALPGPSKTAPLYLLCALWALTGLYGGNTNQEKAE